MLMLMLMLVPMKDPPPIEYLARMKRVVRIIGQCGTGFQSESSTVSEVGHSRWIVGLGRLRPPYS